MNKPNWTILHNKFPPTQLRESDLYGRGRIAQLSFFLLRRSFFACSHGAVSPYLSAPTQRSGYSTNEVDRTNILAPGVCSDLCRNHLLPAFTPENFRGLAQLGSCIQLQQRNCSRFARDFLRRSTFPSSQRTGSRSSGLRLPLQDFSQLSSSRRDKPPAKSINRAVGRQRCFLFGESLKDRIVFLHRSDRAGDVPKIIRRALSNDAA